MKKRPKVLLAITDSFCVAFLRGQAKYLHDRGFDVYLISPDGPELLEYEIEEHCNIVRIPYKREINIYHDIKGLLRTINAIRDIKPNIINAGTPKAGLLCMLAAAYCGIYNRIFTLRGLRSTAVPPGIKRKIVEMMEKLTHRVANKVISISPSMAQYAYQRGILDKNKTVILGNASSNGVNVSRFNPHRLHDRETYAYKDAFGFSNDDIVIGFVGRIVKSKGIEEVYQAFSELTIRNRHLKLLVVGPEEHHSDSISPKILQAMKSNSKVIFTGKVRDVEHLYPLMDIFCLPSHNFREGFGNVAIEASASGIPIIVSKGAGCQDAVKDGETGMLISPQNIEELIRSLKFYIEHPDVRKRHGEEGVKYANRYFRNEIVWDAQYRLYSEMLGIKEQNSNIEFIGGK